MSKYFKKVLAAGMLFLFLSVGLYAFADEILLQLRRYLPEDIGIYSCKNVSERFHARLNAKTKTYIYRLWNSEEPCVFERKFVHVDSRMVDIYAMQKAANHFL